MNKTGAIVEHLRTALIAAETGADDRVFTSFDMPQDLDTFPAILVYRKAEGAATSPDNTGEYDWVALIAITVVVQSRATSSGDGLEALLDPVIKQINAVAMADQTQGGNSHETRPMDIDFAIPPVEEGAQPQAAAEITYAMLYDLEI